MTKWKDYYGDREGAIENGERSELPPNKEILMDNIHAYINEYIKYSQAFAHVK